METKPDLKEISSWYDENYYQGHCGDIPYVRSEYWLRFFHAISDHIVRSLRPRSVLDAGCAKGFLVEAFWERGVEAYGIDISPYAIGEVRKDMQPYCRCVSLTDPIDGRFDLVTCFEVLEHIPDGAAQEAIRNLTAATDTILFSSTPIELTEPTHINVRPTIGWLRLFADAGFAPDLGYDASFVAAHAFLLRRTEQQPPSEVLVLFSQLIRFRLTLGDRHRQLDHLNNEVSLLQSGKNIAEAEVAALNHQLHLLRVERHQQEQELAARAAEIARLSEQLKNSEIACTDRLRDLEAIHQHALEAAAQEHAEAAQIKYETEQAQTELSGTIVALQEYADSLQMTTERLALRLGATETRLADVTRQATQIQQSRIWRTLCAAGAIVLSPWSAVRSLFRSGSTLPAQLPPPAAADFYGLMCDAPRPHEDHPRTGKIAVNGWALAQSGIVRIEVGFPGAAVEGHWGIVRPDVARSFPDVPDSRSSGFSAEIDASAVTNGLHILQVKAFSRSGAVREIQVPIRIDHESGWASDYDRWIAEFETRNESLILLKLRALAVKPRISILVPVYRTPVEILRLTIDSVIRQSYSNWQLCIADDGSQSPAIEQLLSQYTDERIHVKYLPVNGGISHASNAALEMATGEFVALLDHDDELAQDALYYMVEAINLQPDVDLLYSDEDKIDEKGQRYDPFFKPGWSPDLLLSENYLCHFLVGRRVLMNQAGGFRSGFDGSQDYDLVLRLTGASEKVAHVPRVLYHWRSLPSSTASSSSQKTYAVDAARRAIQESLDRRSSGMATVISGCIPGRWRVRYLLEDPPRVSIIIASGGKVEILRKNLDSLFGKTEYANFEVVVIDNSKHMEIRKLVQKWPDPRRPLRYVDWRNKAFNYSVINNEAARHCQSQLLLFLNDDTTVIAPGWLEAMVELAARPEVGAVGAKLLYPDGRIQHAGVVMGLFDNCGHAFKGLAGDRQHYFDLPDVIRNVSAVTGACLMVRATVFQEVGGFDEQTFAVAFNDIDLCLKIGQKGYRVLYTPHALLYHYEAFSKTLTDLVPHPKEVAAMQAKWEDVIAADPFYSPNLTRTAEDYSLRRKA